MQKKRTAQILWSAACLVVLILSFCFLADYFGSKDSSFYIGVQEKLNQRIVSASVVFGITKLISGMITFMQSIEVEVGIAVAGFNMAPLEVLAPVNGTIDKLSNLFLWAMGAIVLQKLLMSIAGWVAFKIVIPVACVFFGVYIWTKRVVLRNAAVMLVAVAVTLSATVPVSVEIADRVERHFLADIHAEAMAGIEDKENAISSLQNEFVAGGDKSAWTTLRETLSLGAIQTKIKNAVDSALTYGKALVTDLLNLFIVTLITVLVIPLATVLVLWVVLRWITKMLTKKLVGQ